MKGEAANSSAARPPGRLGWIAAFLIAAAFVWLHAGTLDLTRFWTEEIRVAEAARSGSVAKAFDYSLSHDRMNVLYNTAAAAAVKIGGPYEPVMRFPALLFGALCFPLLFAVLRRIFPAGFALPALIFLFLSPAFVFISTNAGQQTLSVLLCIAAMIPAVFPAKKRGAAKTAALIIFFAAALYFEWRSAVYFMIGLAIYDAGGAGQPDKQASVHALMCFLTAAVIDLLFVLGLRGGEVSPASFAGIGAGMSFIKRAALIYVAAAGGFAAQNAGLAVAAAIPAAYGAIAILIEKKRSLFRIAAIAAALLVFCVIRSGSASLGVDSATPFIPLISLCIAGSVYYYFGSLRRRDAAGIFSIGLFLRIIFAGFALVLSLIVFFFFDLECISEIHFRARQNWVTAFDRIAESAQPGDTLVIQAAAAPAADYYLKKELRDKLRIEKVEKPDEIEGIIAKRPRSWILMLESGKETYVDSIMKIAFIDGFYAGGYIQIFAGKKKPDTGFSLKPKGYDVDCEFNKGNEPGVKPCVFNIYAPANGFNRNYFSIENGGRDAGVGITVCGKKYDFPHLGTKTVVISGKLKQGVCEIKLETVGIAPDGYIKIRIKRQPPYKLIPSSGSSGE
jgi:hypothetical protein